MKIVMLGHSAAGKTTYVSLMYDLMSRGVEGFTLRAADPYDHRVLKAAARGVRQGRYPDASDQRAVFDLVLQHDGEDVYPFTWRDYRGGALREHGDSQQAGQLRSDLAEADAIVVFADALRLAAEPRAGREARSLVSHVLRALDADREGIVVVLVLFTKCDLLDGVSEETFESRVRGPFAQLLQAIQDGENTVGGPVPVACGPEPANIELPVLFCLHTGLCSRIAVLDATVRSHVENAQSHAARDTLTDRFFSWLDGTPSNAALGRTHQRRALEELERLAPLVEPAERLGRLLDRL